MTPCGSIRDCRFPSSAAAIINRRAAQRFRQSRKPAGVSMRLRWTRCYGQDGRAPTFRSPFFCSMTPEIRFGAPREFPAYKRVGRYSIRANRFLTDDRCQLLPRAGRTPRALSALAISLKVAAPAFRTAWITGIRSVANSSATCACARRPIEPAIQRFVELPSFAPLAFFACRAAIVRSDISRRSFSANAAYRCSMNGSASRPSSATMKGTLCAIKPETNATSRESRSSSETTMLHFALLAAAKAAANCGRLSSASAPFPVSNSAYSSMMASDSAAAKRSIAACGACRIRNRDLHGPERRGRHEVR